MWSKVVYYMTDYWENIADPRTRHISLVTGGIWRILLVTLVYLTVTTRLIPGYMKSRPPYQLWTPIFIYNWAMVVINAYLFQQLISSTRLSMFFEFHFPDPNDRSTDAMNVIEFIRVFMISRLIDLMDTVFFALRKKNNQITFLHLYHHSVVPFLCWLCLKSNPLAPISRMFILINCVIHVFMYLYYALSSCGPAFQKYLWWKKYLTLAQIIQFVICGSYGAILFWLQTDYPMGWFIVVVGQNPVFFVMFYLFYRQSYRKEIKENTRTQWI